MPHIFVPSVRAKYFLLVVSLCVLVIGGTLISFVPVLEDDFESDSGWSLFEEIVGGNSCYDNGIGNVVRSTDIAYSGFYSLKVWANQSRSTKSNHVIASRKYSNQGQKGNWRYQIHVYISPATVNSGQTGPEFSMQNTRQVAPSIFRTTTAGVQYIANPYSGYGDWNVWREQSPGVAGWSTFTTQVITHSVWYTLTLETDYTNNVYKSFSIEGGGINLSSDLSSYRIAQETKFTEDAFVITLEDENLWNNCGAAGVYDYIVYYDKLSLERQLDYIFLPIVVR